MRSHALSTILACIWCTWAVSINNTDDWQTVNNTTIFRNLDSCSQNCIQSVNSEVWDVGQGRFCQSQGCVCSNSTHGENFVNAEGNVTSCVSQKCGNSSVDAANRAFEDLCLVYSLNSTRPQAQSGVVYRIESEDYVDLTHCAKFVVNGCLDANGTRNEANCDSTLKPVNWDLYRGIADQRSCFSSQCLCEDGGFDTTIKVALDAGQKFCAMRPSTKSLPYKEADDMLNVIASYCFSFGFPHRNFTYTYSGDAPGSIVPEGLSMEGKVQIGVAAAALFVALLALLPEAWKFIFVKSAKPSGP